MDIKDHFKSFTSSMYQEKPFTARKAFGQAVGEKIINMISNIKSDIVKNTIEKHDSANKKQ